MLLVFGGKVNYLHTTIREKINPKRFSASCFPEKQ